jgi:hypothetical protein
LTWRPLGAVPAGALVDARLTLHWAAQLVAAVGNSLESAQADDSHTALSWDPARRAFAGARATRLLVESLVLEVGAARFELAGRTRDEALAWLGARVGREPLPAYMHLPPAHPVGAGAPFPPAAAGHAELARWYDDAALVLAPIGTPIRVWPHHFDIAVLVAFGGTRTIGAGLSPGDASYPEPYFYVTPWPYPAGRSGPPLPRGHWRAEGWFGAVLVGGAVTGEAAARSFLDAAFSACRTLLG